MSSSSEEYLSAEEGWDQMWVERARAERKKREDEERRYQDRRIEAERKGEDR